MFSNLWLGSSSESVTSSPHAVVVAHLVNAHKMDPSSLSEVNEMSALHWAALEGQTEAVTVLLEAEPSLLELRDAKGRTAKQIALDGNFTATANAIEHFKN